MGSEPNSDHSARKTAPSLSHAERSEVSVDPFSVLVYIFNVLVYIFNMYTNNGLRLSLKETSDEPLHRQLTTQLRAAILRGELDGEQALPSIRRLAREQRVSVITVQRAYDDLEREGLIHARRGKGFFVSKLTPKHKTRLGEARLERRLSEATNQALADGLSAEQMRRVFKDVLTKGGRR